MPRACINIHKQFRQWDLLKRGGADDLQNLIQRRSQVLLLLRDRHQEVRAHGGPDMDSDAVGRNAEEAPQSQVLFDPTAEPLDGPAAPVDLRDDEGRQVELIAQEDERLPCVGVHVADPAQHDRVTGPSLPRIEADRLIAAQADGPVHGPRLGHVVAGGWS